MIDIDSIPCTEADLIGGLWSPFSIRVRAAMLANREEREERWAKEVAAMKAANVEADKETVQYRYMMATFVADLFRSLPGYVAPRKRPYEREGFVFRASWPEDYTIETDQRKMTCDVLGICYQTFKQRLRRGVQGMALYLPPLLRPGQRRVEE